MKILSTIILVATALMSHGQTSELPASLKNVTHDYSNFIVTTPSGGGTAVALTSAKFNAKDFNVTSNQFSMTSSQIKATREFKISCSELILDNSTIDTYKLLFTGSTLKITVTGKVKIICRGELDLGTTSINVAKGTGGGSLVVEYLGTIGNSGSLKVTDGVNVSFVKK